MSSTLALQDAELELEDYMESPVSSPPPKQRKHSDLEDSQRVLVDVLKEELGQMMEKKFEKRIGRLENKFEQNFSWLPALPMNVWGRLMNHLQKSLQK